MVHRVLVETEAGGEALGRPMGRYITIETEKDTSLWMIPPDVYKEVMEESAAAANFTNGVMAFVIIAVMGAVYINIDRLGQPEELMPLIRPYYIVLLLSLPFAMLFNAFKQFIDSITDTKTAMWIMLSGNIVNIVGNYILIFGVYAFYTPLVFINRNARPVAYVFVTSCKGIKHCGFARIWVTR